MTPHRAAVSRLSLLALPLLASGLLLLAACEGDQDTSEGIRYMEEQALTLDPTDRTIRPAATNAPLAVSPATAAMSAVGDTVVFTASGGRPPYTWGVGNAEIGSIQVVNGNPCVYRCRQLKQNSVWVSDRNNTAAAATIAPAE